MGRPMRKLSIGPLFVLLIIFLVSRFASAATQDLRGRELPMELPAKLPAKSPSKLATKPAKSVAAKKAVPAKKSQATSLPAKTKVAAAPSNGLPKKLPVFKARRVQINFEEIPSTPLDQSVVIIAPALEVHQDPEAIAAQSFEALPQALPDKSPEAPAVAEVATVERPLIEILPSEPTGELWQQDPNAVAAQPLTESTQTVSEAEALATSAASLSASSTGLSDIEAIASSISKSSATTSITTQTEAPSASVQTEQPVQHEEQHEEPLASAIESAKLSHQPTPIESNSGSLSARIETSRGADTEGLNKLFVRAGYLAAKYSDLSPELKNGASTFGVSFAHGFSSWEVKGSLDFAYGLDQSINARNTRMSLARAEGLYLFRTFGFLRPLIGAGAGVATVDVTSYRESENNGEVILREHAQGTAFLFSPQAGLRASFSKSILFDLTAQYLVLAGGSDVSKLGGALLEASFGFAF